MSYDQRMEWDQANFVDRQMRLLPEEGCEIRNDDMWSKVSSQHMAYQVLLVNSVAKHTLSGQIRQAENTRVANNNVDAVEDKRVIGASICA